MAIVYDAQGEAKTLDAVDAREHIATGQWFSDPPAGVAPVVEEMPATVEPARRGRPPGAR